MGGNPQERQNGFPGKADNAGPREQLFQPPRCPAMVFRSSIVRVEEKVHV
jgi:hypothetical protein